ncbi:MAG: hypothetical protein ABSG98_01020 [Anaerolineales bacterium]|jgi:hypothetical protein
MKRLLPWLLLGVLAGLALGLGYAWVLHPIQFNGVAPSGLSQDFQDQYLELIGSAYYATGNLGRARARLALFPSAGSVQLDDLARQVFTTGGADPSVRGLATLSANLTVPQGAQPSAAPSAQPSATPTLVPPLPLTVVPYPTFLPQSTPSSTPPVLFTLLAKSPICDPSAQTSLLEAEIAAPNGNPLPAIEVRIRWDGGQDHFYTGLEPEKGLGYGDFQMTPGVTYQIQVGASEDWISGLTAPSCFETNGTAYSGSLLLTLQSQ